MENDDANVIHVCPGISFQTMTDAVSWFDGLTPVLRGLVEHIGESLFQFNDGEWGDKDGRALLPNNWYRDIIILFCMNDTDECAISLSEFERGQLTANGITSASWRRTYYDTVVPVLMGTAVHTSRRYQRQLTVQAKRSKLKLDQQQVLLKRRVQMKWILKQRKKKASESEPVAKRTRARTRTPPTTPRIKKTGGIKKKGSSGKKKRKKNNYKRR